MFVALPGSGKTTFSRQLAAEINGVTLSSDAVRLAIWGSREAVRASRPTPELRLLNNSMTFGAMQYAAQQVLKAGHSVVYDGTMSTHEDRQRMIAIAETYNACPIIVRIRVPYEVSLQRMQDRDATEDQLKFDLAKAEQTLARFSAEIEEPQTGSFVIDIDGEAPFDEQYREFQTQLADIVNS